MSILVYAWPDGTWCLPEDLEEMQHGRSDDIMKIDIPSKVWFAKDIDSVEDYVNNKVNGR